MSAEREALAEKIARALFTNGAGQHAGRLVLEAPGERLTGVGDLGGWSERAVADRIAALLRAEGERVPLAYLQPADAEALRLARQHGDAVTVPAWWAPEGSRPREVYTIPLHAPEGAKEG